MREIKFRAWDREEKRMTDANFSISRHGKIWWLNSDGALCGAFENPSYAPHYPLQSGFVLMQFTGLKDKNGKEIYEGDIIKGQIETMQFIKGRVYLETEHGRHWGCMIADGPEEKQFGSWDMRQLCWGVDEYTPHCEVIGNIYENPELLWRRVMKSRAEKLDVTTTAIHRLCLHCGKLIIPGRHACEETLKNIEELR